MQFNILILDDETIVANSLKRILLDDEWRVFTANDYEQAEQILKETPIDLLLLDYKLGQQNGITLLKRFKEINPGLIVIMITAYGNIELAVEAMKAGAYDFIQKKEKPDFIRLNVRRAVDNIRLKKEVENLKEAMAAETNMPQIITVSPAMRATVQTASEFAKTDSTILISGETGTGKSLFAEYIHYRSNRFSGSFVSINCAAIPAELIESELFGYERGAFTGANVTGKTGLIEQASGGTLFLDEISELSLELQTRLLHVLEKNEFMKVGAVKATRVDVRFIAATNADLEQLVAEKKFRMDLYYRLNVALLRIPPLRERREDILPLSKYFIEQFNQKFNKSVSMLSSQVKNYLQSATWKGNVRELRNQIERAMLLKSGNKLKMSDFQFPSALPGFKMALSDQLVTIDFKQGKNMLHEAQKALIERTLSITNRNISQAAELLGIPRTTLNHCIRRFGLKDQAKD